MRQLLTLIQIVLPLMAAAQTTSIEAVVVDAQTRQLLPFASIFVSRTNSTISNAVGSFHLACSPTDVLRISFVGYKTTRITAGKVSKQIALEPMTNILNEVTEYRQKVKTLTEAFKHEIFGRKIHTNSVLFNIGDRVIGKGKKLKHNDNLQNVIGEMDYDPQFWKDNDIVLRTPIEEDVFQLFESKQLFGVFK